MTPETLPIGPAKHPQDYFTLNVCVDIEITGLVKAGQETLTLAYERARRGCCHAVSPIQGMYAIRAVSQLLQLDSLN